MRYLVGVTFEPGDGEPPMDQWTAEEVEAHLAYYRRLNDELSARGELVGGEILTGPDLAQIVRSDGRGGAVVTDGPFQEFKEWLAGYQIIDVESPERAVEIAALVSAVPGPDGATKQPVHLRRIMDDGPSDAEEMSAFLHDAEGA